MKAIFSTLLFFSVFVSHSQSWEPRSSSPTNDLGGILYNDLFGSSLDISDNGQFLIVGAPGHNNEMGAVFVYEWKNGWEIRDSIIGNTSTMGQGTEVLISNDGSKIVSYYYDLKPSGYPEEGSIVYEWQVDKYQKLDEINGEITKIANDGLSVLVEGYTSVTIYDISQVPFSKMGNVLSNQNNWYTFIEASDDLRVVAVRDDANDPEDTFSQVYSFDGTDWQEKGVSYPDSVIIRKVSPGGDTIYISAAYPNEKLLKWDGSAWVEIRDMPQFDNYELDNFTKDFSTLTYADEWHNGGDGRVFAQLWNGSEYMDMGGDILTKYNESGKHFGSSHDLSENLVLVVGTPEGQSPDSLPERGRVETFVWSGPSSSNVVKTRSSSYYLYPNPSSEFVSIHGFTKGDEIIVSIWDLEGRIVKQIQYQGKRIDVSQLVPGFYYVTIGDQTVKLIKQ